MSDIIAFDHIRCWRGMQSLEAEAITHDRDGRRYRACLRQPSPGNSPTYKVELWTDTGWQYLLSQNIEQARMGQLSYVTKGDAWHEDAHLDMIAIVAHAMDVLGAKPRLVEAFA